MTITALLTRLQADNMSRVVRKPAFCICENKDADQLRGNREADQRLCFRYIDTAIPLLSKSESSSLLPSSVTVQTGLCRTWSETPKTGFLRTGLNYETLIMLAHDANASMTFDQINIVDTTFCRMQQIVDATFG